MKLYELAKNYNELLTMVENEEATEEDVRDTLDMLSVDIDDKAENIGRLIKNLEIEATGLKAEEERFYTRRKQCEKRIENLKDYLGHTLISLGKEKLATEHFKYSFRKSASVVVEDPDKLPSEFLEIKTTATPIKKAIKEAIESGVEVAGARIVTKNNLQVK